MTFVGLPPELLRVHQGEDGSHNDVQQEMPVRLTMKRNIDISYRNVPASCDAVSRPVRVLFYVLPLSTLEA